MQVMKIHELLITRNFLLHLKNQHQNEQLLHVTDVFLNLFSYDELLSIIDHMTGGGYHDEHPNFKECDKEQLLDFIADQYYILDYLILKIERELGV